MAASRASPFMVINLLVWFFLTLHPARHSLKACKSEVVRVKGIVPTRGKTEQVVASALARYEVQKW